MCSTLTTLSCHFYSCKTFGCCPQSLILPIFLIFCFEQSEAKGWLEKCCRSMSGMEKTTAPSRSNCNKHRKTYHRFQSDIHWSSSMRKSNDSLRMRTNEPERVLGKTNLYGFWAVGLIFTKYFLNLTHSAILCQIRYENSHR